MSDDSIVWFTERYNPSLQALSDAMTELLRTAQKDENIDFEVFSYLYCSVTGFQSMMSKKFGIEVHK